MEVYKIEKKLSNGKAEIIDNTETEVPKLSLLVMIKTLVYLVNQSFHFYMSFQIITTPQVWYRFPLIFLIIYCLKEHG